MPSKKCLYQRIAIWDSPLTAEFVHNLKVYIKVLTTFLGKEKPSDEPAALEALHSFNDLAPKGFHLVPEHVETRSLYNPEKPGIDMVSMVYTKTPLFIEAFFCSVCCLMLLRNQTFVSGLQWRK